MSLKDRWLNCLIEWYRHNKTYRILKIFSIRNSRKSEKFLLTKVFHNNFPGVTFRRITWKFPFPSPQSGIDHTLFMLPVATPITPKLSALSNQVGDDDDDESRHHWLAYTTQIFNSSAFEKLSPPPSSTTTIIISWEIANSQQQRSRSLVVVCVCVLSTFELKQRQCLTSA